MAAESTLEIRLLGGFETRVGAQLVPSPVWRQRRAAAIVKLLALEPGHRLHREQLLDTLWPELDPESAANNLRVSLHHARRGLEDAGAPPGAFLARDGDVVLLGPPEAVQVDVETFVLEVSRAWQSADPAIAARAAELYAGDLLPDDPYEEWAAARRQALRASYLTLLTRLAGLHEERGELAQAIAARERLLLTDPLDEATHAALMHLHARMGNSSLAFAQYARLRSLLDRELGTPPEQATQALAADIRAGRVALAPISVAPPAAPPPPLSVAAIAPGARLPAPVDDLVGREREVAELGRLLGTARLVTLTGAGGIGKTRLAQEAARACSAQFPDGVAFIDLAPLGDSALVLPTIARAIGVDETGGRPTSERLAATIGERRMLLVLDSSEHLAAAGPEAAALLESCPHLTVLTTSRIRPRLRGEQEYPVVPLALPDSQATVPDAPLAELAQVAAIELFARRAMAARPSFALTDQNIDPVVAICRRLDGLPLAIELAAAQVRVLSPVQLLHRLERPLDVLGTTAQDVPARQRTLRAAIAWSYDLLSPQEQVLFRRLSVFAGGWPLEATEAITTIDGDTTTIDAVATLARLIDQNLVQTRQVRDGDELRYSMLETIREFATERLTDSGEGPAVRDSHVSWMTHLAADASRGFFGPDEILWLDRIEGEHDNIRAALAWLTRSGDTARASQITGAIWWFWGTRGYGLEGLDWIEKGLSDGAEPADGDRDRIDTLTGAAWIAALHGEAGRAARYAEQAVALAKIDADDAACARPLFMLSLARGGQGDRVAAARHAAEALALFQRVGDRAWIPFALNRLGVERSEQEDYVAAAALYEEALTGWRDVGQPWGIGTALLNLGLVARQLGDNERAASLLRECIPLAVTQGDRWGLVELLIGLADIAAVAGDPGLGARLLSAANRIHTELGIALQSYVAHIQTRAFEAAELALGREAFAAEWAKGHALSLDEAIGGAMRPEGSQTEPAGGVERIELEDPGRRGSASTSPRGATAPSAQDPI